MNHICQPAIVFFVISAKPARGATRHTAQQSSEVDDAASDAADVVAAGTVAELLAGGF